MRKLFVILLVLGSISFVYSQEKEWEVWIPDPTVDDFMGSRIYQVGIQYYTEFYTDFLMFSYESSSTRKVMLLGRTLSGSDYSFYTLYIRLDDDRMIEIPSAGSGTYYTDNGRACSSGSFIVEERDLIAIINQKSDTRARVTFFIPYIGVNDKHDFIIPSEFWQKVEEVINH